MHNIHRRTHLGDHISAVLMRGRRDVCAIMVASLEGRVIRIAKHNAQRHRHLLEISRDHADVFSQIMKPPTKTQTPLGKTCLDVRMLRQGQHVYHDVHLPKRPHQHAVHRLDGRMFLNLREQHIANLDERVERRRQHLDALPVNIVRTPEGITQCAFPGARSPANVYPVHSPYPNIIT